MELSDETWKMMFSIANHGGSQRYYQSDAPYPDSALWEATKKRLVTDRGADESGVISLTNKGRELVGLPPKPTVAQNLSRLSAWAASFAKTEIARFHGRT